MGIHFTRGQKKFLSYIGFISALAIGALMLAYIYVIPYIINWDDYRSEVASRSKEIIGRELIIDGKIDFTAFPYPKFTIGKTRLKNKRGTLSDNMITVSSIEIRPSLLHLIVGKINVSEVILHKPVFELENLFDSEPNWLFFKNQNKEELEKTKANLMSYFKVNRISMNNAILKTTSGQRKNPITRELTINNTSFTAETIDGPYAINGRFELKDANLFFDYSASMGNLETISDIENNDNNESKKEYPKVKLSILFGTSKLNIEGIAKRDEDGLFISAKLDSQIDKSARSLGTYFGGKKSIFPSLVNRIISSSQTEITSDFNLSSKGIQLDNLKYKSLSTNASDLAFFDDTEIDKEEVNEEKEAKNIAKTFDVTGQGALGLSFDDRSKINFKMLFNEINLDAYSSGDISAYKNIDLGRELSSVSDGGFKGNKIVNAEDSDKQVQFEVSEDINLLLDVAFDKLRYKNQTLTNFDTKIEIEGKKLNIYSFNVKGLPGDTKVKWVSKEVGNNEVGNLKQHGGNILIHGKELTPLLEWLGNDVSSINDGMFQDFKLNANVNLSTNEIHLSKISINFDGANILGQALLKRRGGTKANMAFRLGKFNIDKYFRTVETAIDLKDLNADQIKFDFLRNIDTYFNRLNINLAIDELIYKGESFNNINTTARFTAGQMNIKQLEFTSRGKKVSAVFDLDTRDLKPKIKIEANFKELHTDIIELLFDIELPEVIFDEYQRPIWPDDSFSFDRIGIFVGDIKFFIEKFDHNGFILDNLLISLSISSDKIIIHEYKAKIFDSKIEGKGEIGTKRPSLNLVFSIANANLENILTRFFNFKKLSGKLSISGGVAMIGSNVKQWISSLQGSASVMVNDAVIDGFDLNLMARKIPSLNRARNVRYWANKALASGLTKIDQIDGNIEYNQGLINLTKIKMTRAYMSTGSVKGSLDLNSWRVNINAYFPIYPSEGGPIIPVYTSVYGGIELPSKQWDIKAIEDYWETYFF